MVNFLELTPKPPSEAVTIETAEGPVAVELRGIKLGVLADIAKRYPAFAKFIDGGGASIVEAAEAMPALIAAGLDHAGDAAYETKIREFPASDILAMGLAIVRLTFPQQKDAPLPLPPGADGAAGPPMVVGTTSPPLLSS